MSGTRNERELQVRCWLRDHPEGQSAVDIASAVGLLPNEVMAILMSQTWYTPVACKHETTLWKIKEV